MAMNRVPNHQQLAEELAGLESDQALMEHAGEVLTTRGKLQAFMEALPKLNISATVRNMIFILLATLLITACGGGSDLPDGDTDGDNPIVDGDGENPDGDQEAIDGDTTETDGDVDGDEEVTDGDSDGDTDGDQIEDGDTDGDTEVDGDEAPDPCSQFGPEDALTVAHVCSEGQETPFILSGIQPPEDDNEADYSVYNGTSVNAQFEGCGCVLARPACDVRIDSVDYMLTICGIRFIATLEDGEVYDRIHADFSDLFYPGGSLSLYALDLETDEPFELDSTLAEQAGTVGTLASDFRTVRSKSRDIPTDTEYIAYFQNKPPAIDSVTPTVNGSVVTVDLNVTDDKHDVFDEAYQDEFGKLNAQFKEKTSGTVYAFGATNENGSQYSASLEPGTYTFVVTMAPEGGNFEESTTKKEFEFTIDATDPCEGFADDGNPCNGEETCDPVTGESVPGTPIDHNDGNPCNGEESCNPVDGSMIAGTPIDYDDGNPCNGEESCNPENGEMVAGTPIDYDDGNACNGVETCDTETGLKVDGTPLNYDDGNACNGLETCDPVTGNKIDGTPIDYDDGNPCNGEESCNPADGSMIPGTPINYDDGNFCNGPESCDPADGSMVQGETPCNDNEACDEENDRCVPAPVIDVTGEGLGIDCGDEPCWAGGTTYPVRFNVSNTTNCAAHVEMVSGSGTPGSVSEVTIDNGLGYFDYTTGSTAYNTVKLIIECENSGKMASAHINVTLE